MPIRRSQVILRMPVDNVVAQMIAHDGTKADVMLFIPPTEDIGQVLGHGAGFLPMVKGGKMCIVARDTIACFGVPAIPVIPHEDDLPVEKQAVTVTMRSGATIEGELFLTGFGTERTTDFMNEAEVVFRVHGTATTFYVSKSHVAQVEEK
ncbi:MAG: hypothetical protein ACKV2T_03125 [Kofleriaceae bacterium]